MNPDIIQTRNLSKHYGGVRAVDNLALNIEQGKITGIVGPNGSGKSTLVNLLSGMTVPSAGLIVIDGVKREGIDAPETPAYGITRTFQEIRLFEQMPVLDNVLVALTKRSVLGAIFERNSDLHLQKAHEVLSKVGLLEKRNALAHDLSYGQRKLLEVARALAMNAEIYLLDEPFAGLFPEMVRTIVGIIKELRTHGKTVILIEHNMELIRELSDKVIVMDSGKLLAEGRAEEVLHRRDVVEAYLGE